MEKPVKHMQRVLLWTVLPILIDQGVKLIIQLWFFEERFAFIPGILTFRPVINDKLSWLGGSIPLFSHPVFLLSVNVFILIALFAALNFYCKTWEKPHFAVKFLFSLAIAGCFCSLLDKLFWGGSLDFIRIPGLFIFDLKDVYLTVFEVMAIILAVKHSQKIRYKDFFRYYSKKS